MNKLHVNKLRAFHGDPKIKDIYVARVRAHAEADEIARGFYWLEGRGCGVGCTIHSGLHSRYETELGIPTALAYLEDGLFENMPCEMAKTFPLEFLEAIPVGADLSQVTSRFLLWLLADETDGVIRFAKTDEIRAAIEGCAALHRQQIEGQEPPEAAWSAARSAAVWAAEAAESAIRSLSSEGSAAESAVWAAAAWSAEAAAWSAARAAAWSAARSAAESAVWAAARSAAFVRQKDYLLILLRAASVDALEVAHV